MLTIRQQFPDLFLDTMLPALDSLVNKKFKKKPSYVNRVFRVMPSGRSIEQTSEIAGLGIMGSVPEGVRVRYDQPVPGFRQTYTHSQFGMGFMVSRILVDDDRMGIISTLATDLGRSAYERRELDAASTFNNGFDAAFAGPDGKPLFATDHPLVKSGGAQTNTLAVAADLDVPSLELACTDFRRMKDPTGKLIRVTPKTLIVPPESSFAGVEILYSTMRSDTANHATNAFKKDTGNGVVDDLLVWDYLTDPDAWFLHADLEDTELRWYDREAFNTVHDVDFDSRSIKTAGWMRYSFGWSGFYGIYGVPGA